MVNNKPHFNYHGKGNEEKYPHPHQFVKPYQSIGDGFGGYDQDEIDRHNQHVENKRGRDIMPRHYDLMDAKAMNEYGIDAKEWRKIDYKVRIKLIDYLGLYN